MRIFSERTCEYLLKKIHEGEDGDRYRGIYVYCNLGRMLLNAWFAEASPDATPQQSIQDAACVLASLVAWRREIAVGTDLRLQTDTLTRETIIDTITSTQTCILRFPLFRIHYPDFKPYGPNFGQSRFSEYGFQFARAKATNTPSLSCKGFVNMFGHLNYQTHLEASSGLKIPCSHRGVPHSIERGKHETPPKGYFPSDDELMAYIQAGFDRACFLWGTVSTHTCMLTADGILSSHHPAPQVLRKPIDVQPGCDFFTHPWKHFNLPAELKAKATHACETGGDDDESDHTAAICSQDADDAAQLIGSLVAEQVQQGDETTCGERPTQAELDLAAEIGPVVAGYNRSIVEEKLSRRERFRTERLVDARQRATGQTVDEQLDFLCEEDNCAVVFEDESGKLFWVLGHIEYMATTRSDVSLNRIAPRDLERLEKDHQVRVSIDDSRSIFLFKWYIEVDKDGKDLPGYQNKV
jgi:hypothetical protein